MEWNLQGKPMSEISESHIEPFEDTIDHCNNLMTQKSPWKPFHSSKGFKTIAQCMIGLQCYEISKSQWNGTSEA